MRPDDQFLNRHLGSAEAAIQHMLEELSESSLDSLIDDAVPPSIRIDGELDLPAALTEVEAIARLKSIMSQNEVKRSFIGMGYYGCVAPPVIQRNILENPGWYTAYTPYQAEIAQGRLEALLNYQTMVTDLTGLEVANASLLDEATAAAEAMSLCAVSARGRSTFFVSEKCHPQTIDVVFTRAQPLGITVVVGDHRELSFEENADVFGVLLQYPDTDGSVHDYAEFIARAHAAKAMAVVATDLLALTLLKPPGEFGADIAVGSSQRFGVPLGYGGPHAAFIAVKDALKRKLPGRIVGVSHDVEGRTAYRLSLQTREQHIRRDKATSNICTAQVLLAVIASMFAVYHGPDGVRRVACRVRAMTRWLADKLAGAGVEVVTEGPLFDTIKFRGGVDTVDRALAAGYNLRLFEDGEHLGISLDQTTNASDLEALLAILIPGDAKPAADLPEDLSAGGDALGDFERESGYLSHPVFNSYHSETEMLRYLHRLESRDLALNTSMIPLGSCTMKLNATSEMMPLSWPEVMDIHPFAPVSQTRGYAEMFELLESWLAECTGFAKVSLQPNAGSQGEYAGLLAIRRYHLSRGDTDRSICLIPTSAHGTNPASAVMAGFKVVAIACDDHGNIDVADLKAKAEQHAEALGALMVTYPSTHGVFEASIREICEIIHANGGQVYMDGANMNAQVGLCSPGDIGADVCHLNLHKTFCIPHGGGGPGVGPIGVAEQLVPFLPGHRFTDGVSEFGKTEAVCAAPWGSSCINTISWMYIAMMGPDGLTRATKLAILNANYIAKRLEPFYPILYRGNRDLVAHECIIDLRGLKEETGIDVEDVAKRLIDFGFHAPTMSWPVPGTLMIEPTESESLEEIDRFCESMITIHGEIMEVKNGAADPKDNVLKNAPHTAATLLSDDWDRPYSREQAAYPADWTRQFKFWPVVSRIDNVFGDRNLVCTCESVEAYVSAAAES